MHTSKKACIQKLLREARGHYQKAGRHDLPWRRTRDPYRILVSEVMLQQTQVRRVRGFYARFVKKFPTARALARAPLSDVLEAWQGLGYNRRAKYLQDAAKILAKEKFSGQKLPGAGPYTRGAVMAFAFNKPEIFIETNIRTVLFHSQILKKTRIDDKELLPIVGELLKKSKMPPREFYWMLMDYGAALKKRGVRLNHRSTHYAKQSKFEGSRRQRRAALLRALLRAGAPQHTLLRALASR